MPPISYGVMNSAEIETTACAASTALRACGLSGCFFGSAACMLYGTTRTPNVSPLNSSLILIANPCLPDLQDIDVVIFSSGLEQEEIKRRIVYADPAFFLVASTNRRNTYKILWYNLHGAGRPVSRACKVDILIPGLMNIPSISHDDCPYASLNDIRIDVLPFIPMLLLKLQGWTDHLLASPLKRPDLYSKRHVDVQDIKELLQIATNRKDLLDGVEALHLPLTFVAAGRLRIQQFCRFFPETKPQWDMIPLPQPRQAAFQNIWNI